MPDCEHARLTIPQRYLEMVLRILAQCVPHAEVWAYGSRVDGSCYDASDLDLVLRNPSDLEKPVPDLFELRNAFTESNIPIRVDVMDWARIPESFRRNIVKGYVALRKGETRPLPQAQADASSSDPVRGDTEISRRDSSTGAPHGP